MSENSGAVASRSIPLIPVALLITIGLLVANGAGWIHIGWFWCWLPVIIAVGFVLAMLALAAGILIVGFTALNIADKKASKRTGIVTPTRHRGLK